VDGFETNLQAGALKLPSVLMQGITHIAPAAGIVLTIQSTTKLAGVAAPLAYTIGFVIMLTLALSLAELAKHLPSAGGYYTYVSRTVHPRAGFLTAWLFFLYGPAGTAINLVLGGHLIQQSLLAEYHISCPWWAFFVVAALATTFLVYRGIEVSVEIMMVLGLAEIAIVVALAITGLLWPGDGGVNLHSFSPGNAPSIGGLYLAVIFSIFCFMGFESVAPLAEESENPRRNLPLAIVGAVTLMGAFYVFCPWGILTGWGTRDLSSLIGLSESNENPLFVLARHCWGRGWILILLALLNSVLAVAIACTNASTRVFFAMARSGALPHALARIHPIHRTPSNAIWLQTFVTLTLGLGLGFWIGPEEEFMLLGVAMTLGMVCVYCAGNLGVFLFFRKEHRSQFSLFRHLLLPLVSSMAMIWVGYKTINPAPDPALAPPVCYAPYLVAVWLAFGIAILIAMKRAGREDWLLRAGQIAFAQGDSSGEENKGGVVRAIVENADLNPEYQALMRAL
jgi:amino acid transporter